MRFHPEAGKLQVYTAGDDCTVRAWDLNTHKCEAKLEKHLSQVTAVGVSTDGRILLTAGRDKIVQMWDLTRDYAALKTVPVYESIEDMVVLPTAMVPGAGEVEGLTRDALYFATVGERGVVRVWQQRSVTGDDKLGKGGKGGKAGNAAPATSKACLCLYVQDEAQACKIGTTGILVNKALNALVSVTAEHDLVFQRLAAGVATEVGAGVRGEGEDGSELSTLSLERDKVLVGYNDEVIDVKYVPRLVVGDGDGDGGGEGKGKGKGTMVWDQAVVATNSDKLRLVDLNTFGTTLLSGHTDIVLSVDVSPDGRVVASVGKDHSVRLWNVETRECVAMGEGHTEAAGAVGFSRRAAPFATELDRARKQKKGGKAAKLSPDTPMLFTGSKDRTLKKWDMRPVFASLLPGAEKATAGGAEVVELRVLEGARAHEKDINALCVSPNDRLVATASQDRTVKLWATGDLGLVHTLRGHKRGVWSVDFSPVDRCLVTGSGDRTLKIWSVVDGSCMRTFEGHTASVLGAKYLQYGMQVMSSGADGLVKLWVVKTNECINTFDSHYDKVWALDIRPTPKLSQPAVEDGAGAAGEGKEEGGAAALNRGEMITGGGDSLLNVWHDVTAEQAEEAVHEQELRILKEQELFNKEKAGELVPAICLAIELDAPFRLHGIFERVVAPRPLQRMGKNAKKKAKKEKKKAPEDMTDEELEAERLRVAQGACKTLDSAVEALTLEQIGSLVGYVKAWNANSRHSHVAQHVLGAVLRHVSAASLANLPRIGETVDALEAYSERHFSRLDRLSRKTYLLDFTLESMKTLLPMLEEEEEESKRRGKGARGMDVVEDKKDDDEDDEEEEEDDENEDEEEEEEEEVKKKASKGGKAKGKGKAKAAPKAAPKTAPKGGKGKQKRGRSEDEGEGEGKGAGSKNKKEAEVEAEEASPTDVDPTTATRSTRRRTRSMEVVEPAPKKEAKAEKAEKAKSAKKTKKVAVEKAQKVTKAKKAKKVEEVEESGGSDDDDGEVKAKSTRPVRRRTRSMETVDEKKSGKEGGGEAEDTEDKEDGGGEKGEKGQPVRTTRRRTRSMEMTEEAVAKMESASSRKKPRKSTAAKGGKKGGKKA